MLKSIITLAAIVASTAALATDLPSKKEAPAPVFTQAQNNPFYVGVRGGGLYKDEVNNWTVGGNAGYEVNKFARVEVGYDRLDNKDIKALKTDAVTGNAIAQLPIGIFNITPYALAGVGYGWSDYKNGGIYNVGGGVRYGVTNNVELDARYRYISDFKNEVTTNAFTAGVNYKF
jgi:opacity protein-like surface antigen